MAFMGMTRSWERKNRREEEDGTNAGIACGAFPHSHLQTSF